MRYSALFATALLLSSAFSAERPDLDKEEPSLTKAEMKDFVASFKKAGLDLEGSPDRDGLAKKLAAVVANARAKGTPNPNPPSSIKLAETNAKKATCDEIILTEFGAKKPNIDLFIKTAMDFAHSESLSPVKLVSDILSGSQKFKNEKKRITYFLQKILNHVQEQNEAQSTDYIYYGFACMGESPKIPDSYFQPQYKKAYINLQKAVELVNIGKSPPLKDLSESYSFLTHYTFINKLYKEHIIYSQVQLKNYGNSFFFCFLEAGFDSTEARLLDWEAHLNLAQSYFYCRQYEDSFKFYKRLENFKHFENDHPNKDFIEIISRSNLITLYSLYMTLKNEDDRQVLKRLYLKLTEECKENKFSKLLTRRMLSHNGKNRATKSAATTPNTSASESLRDEMRQSFVQEQHERIKSIHHKIRELNLTKSEHDQHTYGISDEYVGHMKLLVGQVDNIYINSAKFVNAQAPKQVRELRMLHEEMVDLQSQLEKEFSSFQEIVRCKIREQRQPKNPGFINFVTSSQNKKVEVMKDLEQAKEKEKTKGEPVLSPPPAPTLDQKPEIEDSPVNSILTCSKEVWHIMTTQHAGDYPPCTVERLTILNRSSNIKELEENLKLFDADLKKLSGAEEGKMSFRLNKKYRVRFEVTDEGFTNVEVGDFH